MPRAPREIKAIRLNRFLAISYWINVNIYKPSHNIYQAKVKKFIRALVLTLHLFILAYVHLWALLVINKGYNGSSFL